MRKVSSGSLLRALRRLRTLTGGQRTLLLEATVRLALVRLAIVLVPFRLIAPRLAAPVREASAQDTADVARLRQVSWAIEAVSRRAPWRCKCLEQGIAAKLMLRRRRFANTLYLGVTRDNEQLVAHAWLRSGDVCVTGGSDVARYAVVSTFADEPGSTEC